MSISPHQMAALIAEASEAFGALDAVLTVVGTDGDTAAAEDAYDGGWVGDLVRQIRANRHPHAGWTSDDVRSFVAGGIRHLAAQLEET